MLIEATQIRAVLVRKLVTDMTLSGVAVQEVEIWTALVESKLKRGV